MSNIDIAAVALEINRVVQGYWIDNIYQLNPRTILLKLRGGDGESQLLIEAGRRAHLTSYVYEKPLKPPSFCMALRKYLRNCRITQVEQYQIERILEIKVADKDGQEYRLIIELFSHGNLILLNSDNRILHALKYRRMRDRNIIRGEVYQYPPRRGINLRTVRRVDISGLRGFGQIEVVRALARFLDISGTYAEEILARAYIPKNAPCSSLSDRDLDAIFKSIQNILSDIYAENWKPSIILDEEQRYVDVTPMELQKYSGFKRLEFRSFNEALDEYYAKASSESEILRLKEDADREIEHLKRILREQEETVRRAEEEAEGLRVKGDIIFRHLGEVQLLMEWVMQEKRQGKNWQEIADELRGQDARIIFPFMAFEEIDERVPELRINIEGQSISLDLKVSAQNNASRYYEKSKRAARKVEGAKAAIKETLKKIGEVEQRLIEEEKAEMPKRKPRREWYEKFRWFHSSDGCLVLGGKDASTNETLIRKYTGPKDIILHADITGAPFVVIKADGGEPSEKTIREAAQFAASYSSAWKAGLASLDVYWVKPEQVSKAPPSGEYLPKGSFMIYGRRNYIKNVPLEVAIGVKRVDGSFKVIGGPPEAVANQAEIFVRLVPGKEASGRLARMIREELIRSAPSEDREEIGKIPLEEIQRFIPAGRGAISKPAKG
ncbi:MAG: NFACT family protein [Candidatus Bathyarchaeota archaeon]|nr:NFACT family protein [Candidatus Bathyarchaeota archaeon]